MKKYILAIIMALAVAAPATLSSADRSHRGEKSLGVKVGYATRNESMSFGIAFDYRFSSHFAISPNIDYVFRNRGTDAFLFNIDTRYPLALTPSGRWEFYPILGLNYVSWNMHWEGDTAENPFDDVSTRRSRFGFTAGAGIDWRVTPTLKLRLQGRFNGVKHLSTGLFSLGIAYCF